MSPRDVHQSDRLSTLPVDVLVDSLLPTFPTCDVIALARTCREWHTFLTCAGQDSEIYWMRKCIHDFNFPVHASGRRTGWFPLYATLARSAAYVWGQNDNARLGLSESTYQLEPELRARLLEGGLVLPTRIELPQAPVSIVAGGWSFHALTADGKVMSWGTLNGGTWSRDDAPLHHEGRALKPTVLPQCDAIGPIKQLEAGRGHAVMLSRDGNVFEFRSFGRIVKIVDESRRWQAGTDVSTVYAGWDYSALLTRAGDVFVWWEPGVARVERGARSAGEDSLPSPSTQGVTFALELDTLRLPSLPDHPRGANEGDKIKLLACGDNFVIALSERSRLYYLSLSPVPDPAQPFARQGAVNDSEDSPVRSRESMARLEAEFLSGRRTWRLMQKFCDRSELEKLDQVRTRPLPETFEITHISAHFNTFAAYSVSATSDSTQSLVLLGDSDWHEQAAPNLIPELQGRGVIKVAHGDYHHLALTSSGELFAWGSFSGGALGLGHPQLADTPLSLTPSHPGRSQGEGSEPRHVHNPNQPLTTPTNRAPPPPHQAFPGFAATPRPALNNRPRAPSRVERPTKVKFDGGRANAAGSPSPSRARDSFVYAVTASGWHSGALAVDLDRSPPLQTSAVGRGTTASSQQGGGKGSDETGGGPIIRLEPHSTGSADRAAQHTGDHRSETSTGTAAGGTSIGSRIGRTFRIGLAGASGTRGANLGGAGGAVRPPSR